MVRVCFSEGARNALSLAGTVMGYYPVRVLPSKTAIIPVNPTFLPRVRPQLDFGQAITNSALFEMVYQHMPDLGPDSQKKATLLDLKRFQRVLLR